jgi:hypothetical protein
VVGPDFCGRRVFARRVIVGLKWELVLARQDVDEEPREDVVPPCPADVAGLRKRRNRCRRAFQRFGHGIAPTRQRPLPQREIAVQPSHLTRSPGSSQPEFKAAPSVTTTDLMPEWYPPRSRRCASTAGVLLIEAVLSHWIVLGPPGCVNQPTRTSAPPLTGSATPVMKLASSDARNSAAVATSHAVPIRPRSGTLASRSAATSARLRLLARVRVSTAIGVFMSPGKMQLARMPHRAFCRASCSVNAIFEDNRPQSQFVSSERPGPAGDADPSLRS